MKLVILSVESVADNGISLKRNIPMRKFGQVLHYNLTRLRRSAMRGIQPDWGRPAVRGNSMRHRYSRSGDDARSSPATSEGSRCASAHFGATVGVPRPCACVAISSSVQRTALMSVRLANTHEPLSPRQPAGKRGSELRGNRSVASSCSIGKGRRTRGPALLPMLELGGPCGGLE